MYKLPLTAFFLATLTCLSAALPEQFQVSLRPEAAKSPDSWDYIDCGEAGDAVQIVSISVSPDPPKIGSKLTVTIDAIVKETIEEGATADVKVKAGLIKLLERTFDLCDEARNANTSISCPVAPGPYTISQTVELPKEVPKLKYVITVRAFTVDEDPMVCVDLKVQFSPFYKFWE
ncbi:ML domain-containing protein [Mycena sp. CBHHK59/15]|nr:ML domain-containing protein [Mycena sp. CBHHK59/15]